MNTQGECPGLGASALSGREWNCRGVKGIAGGVRGTAGMREGNGRGVRGIAGMCEGEWRLIC